MNTDTMESENANNKQIIKSIEYQLFAADMNPNSSMRDNRLKEWKEFLNQLEMMTRKLTKDTMVSNKNKRTKE